MIKRNLACLLLAAPLLFAVGCGSGGPTNIVDDTNAEQIAEYEAALAEADAMTEGYEGE
ncbi:hypothetical protein LOC71_17565 [Rhodopirellula sp. JC740]|uniref:Secreted protein n=1 Tax=Rhodopirellula halodulae TaxID=2894198 RepID=A0ABS8NL44_9BACT|nr:hypothetical protein [Rhodopirellula sp. JC740]MCC9644094.1 hypothetical protein [Rhodopirellula sp. JC740]